MTLFKPRVGKVIFAQTTRGLPVIIPKINVVPLDPKMPLADLVYICYQRFIYIYIYIERVPKIALLIFGKKKKNL